MKFTCVAYIMFTHQKSIVASQSKYRHGIDTHYNQKTTSHQSSCGPGLARYPAQSTSLSVSSSIIHNTLTYPSPLIIEAE